MTAEPNTSSRGNQKSVCASDFTVDEVNEILQNCGSDESDIELSDSGSHSDAVKETDICRNDFGNVDMLGGPAKRRNFFSVNPLISGQKWNNNKTSFQEVTSLMTRAQF
jgi:hypothetical protein